MKKLLLIGMMVVALGCEATPPADQGDVMKACAQACKLGDSKMSKWNYKDGCVCDVNCQPKLQ